MKKKLHLIIIGLCLSILCLQAQENSSRQLFQQAKNEYDIGHIEQALQLLQDHVASFDDNLKQSAYRLMSLCYLYEDKDVEARYYAEQLIKLNNYYNSTGDPPRFQDLISQLKEGITTTITTASSQSETINEAPVPITIITSEMIEEMGYNKSLSQILSAYVPGMAEMLSTYEIANMSMHGAYSNDQELILIMENGHRLNNRFNNSGPVSYSISTEKIDHIEVLRGPASSLYGNVALSAVVNIITKSGRTNDGVKAKYGYASYGTHKADFTIGTQFMDADIFAWASLYKSDGQIRHYGDGKGYLKNHYTSEDEFGYFKSLYISPDRIYVDGYKDAPAYDLGLTFKLKGFDMMFSKKNVKKVQQHTTYYGGYDYDDFAPIFGVKPGYGTESTHAEIGYTKQIRKIYLNTSVYSDWYKISNYDVLYDSIINTKPVIISGYNGQEVYETDENGKVIINTIEESGLSMFNFYHERTMGGMIKASTDYMLSNMKGNALAGAQYEYFSLLSVMDIWSRKYGEIDSGQLKFNQLSNLGKEKSLSFFMQDKHYFLQRLILNAGFRYDLKYRKNEKVVRTISPRLSLLYVPHERFTFKLCYSEAFADLSFYNRYLTKTEYSSLDPQHLSALQLTATGNLPQQHLNYELNFFYNKYTNLLCWQLREEYMGKNSGELTNAGIEGTAYYSNKRLSANVTLYYCKDISSKHYYYNSDKKEVCGVPHFMLNLHGAWKLVQTKNHEIKIYGHSKYQGRRLNFEELKEDDFYVDSKMTFDLGCKYQFKELLQFSIDFENIFNTDYYLCGHNNQFAPKIQRGRTLMASLSFQI